MLPFNQIAGSKLSELCPFSANTDLTITPDAVQGEESLTAFYRHLEGSVATSEFKFFTPFQ